MAWLFGARRHGPTAGGGGAFERCPGPCRHLDQSGCGREIPGHGLERCHAAIRPARSGMGGWSASCGIGSVFQIRRKNGSNRGYCPAIAGSRSARRPPWRFSGLGDAADVRKPDWRPGAEACALFDPTAQVGTDPRPIPPVTRIEGCWSVTTWGILVLMAALPRVPEKCWW